MPSTVDVWENYPHLAQYTKPVRAAEREIVGRADEMQQILATMKRPEIRNCILLGEAGSGKTALVQKTMLHDKERVYRELDMSLLKEAGRDKIDAALKGIFDEAGQYVLNEKHELVIFIDEFHQIVQVSEMAVETIKPLLAAAGTNARLIAATTLEEYHEFIRPNQALAERLQRISLSQPNHEETINILKGYAQRYGIADSIYGDYIYELIYDYTERFIKASSQPRKSLMMLDNATGWHRLTGAPINKDLIDKVLKFSSSHNPSFRINATRVSQALSSAVYGQPFAVESVTRQLELCIADMADKGKPQTAMLFAGPPAVGKTEMAKQLTHVLFGDVRNHFIRFDMTEYADEGSLERFMKRLTRVAWNQPHSVCLFDEVEKANANVVRIMLQVLDDARLTDENDRVLDFSNMYIIMTTNAGQVAFDAKSQYSNKDAEVWARSVSEEEIEARADLSAEQKAQLLHIKRRPVNIDDEIQFFKDAIRNTTGDGKFPPELLSRLDIIPFYPLSRGDIDKIIERGLVKLRNELSEKRGMKLEFTESVREYLHDKALTTAKTGVARDMNSRIRKDIRSEVAIFLNRNPQATSALVKTVGASLREDTTQRQTSLQIKVVDTSGRL